MNEQELMNQLKQADQAAGMPNLAPLDIPTLRRQVQRRQSVRRVLSVAAGLALVVGWWHFRPPLHEPPGTPMQTAADQLAALDTGAQQLDRLFDLVEQEQKFHQKERQVEAQVAAITEPLREVSGASRPGRSGHGGRCPAIDAAASTSRCHETLSTCDRTVSTESLGRGG